jgi:hypothetical protein
MATTNAPSGTAPSAIVKAYEDKINAQLKESKARLEMVEAKAQGQRAQAEITTINSLKATRQNIDRKLQDLRTAHETHVAQAKASIEADVATFMASVDQLSTKFKSRSE